MHRLQRFFAALLLLAYTSTGTSLAPAAAMALASLGGSHQVKIRQSEQGMQVLLHHAEHEYTPEVADHASPLTRLVVSMCRPDPEGDHSLSLREVGGSITNSNDDTKREVRSAAPLNPHATLNLLIAQPRMARREPGRAGWGIFRGGCRHAGHTIVTTTQLLI